MTSILIQPSAADDVPALTKVIADTGLFPPEMLEPMIMASLGEQSDGFWLTAVLDGNPVGASFTQPEEMADGVWNMLALAVAPDQQNLGVGAALVAEAEAFVTAKGARLLLVDTSSTPDFAGARSFYLARAYEEEARIRNYWADGDDKVTFRKDLRG